MRSFFLIPMILLISCGRPNEKVSYGLAINPAFKGQSLTASQIQCESIKTNFSKDSISCPTAFLNEEKQYLFSMKKEEIDLTNYPQMGQFELEISNKELIHANFYLVSKYGKRLTDDVFFDGKSIRFQELRRGDFISHEIYLKISNYLTDGIKRIEVKAEEDSNCETGIFNIEEINLSDLSANCKNLKFIPKVSASVVAPEILSKQLDSKVIKFHQRPSTSVGIKIEVEEVLYRITIKSEGKMKQQNLDSSLFYEVKQDEFGLDYRLKNLNYCFLAGVTKAEKNKNNKFYNADLRKLGKTIFMVGKTKIKNERRRLCFNVDPKLIGQIIVKE